MTENQIERAEKAVEALVYGTVGLALYVRDTAPSFIRLFVARGKNELGQPGKAVADPLAQVRSLGDMAAQGAPQLLRVVGDQVGRLRERAEDVIAGFGAPAGTPAAPPPYSPAPPPTPARPASGTTAAKPSPPTPPASPPASPAQPSPSATAAAAAAASATGTEFPETDAGTTPPSWQPPSGGDAAAAPTGPASGLAITNYDELSASQVVDRLEGLPRHELEAIREYEREHRARNTILGKIEQLTR